MFQLIINHSINLLQIKVLSHKNNEIFLLIFEDLNLHIPKINKNIHIHYINLLI